MAGTTRSTWADGMILGTTATEDGMEVGTTHITDTCTLTTAVGMEVGTHTGATTRTITTLSILRMTTGTVQGTAQDPTGYSPAGFPQEEEWLRQAE